MGRPRSFEPRTQQLNLSFSVSEFTDICQRAYALGMRPAHFCRAQLLRQNSRLEKKKANENVSRLILDQLRRLGNNLNQIARALNQNGESLPADLEPLLTDIRDLIARVRR